MVPGTQAMAEGGVGRSESQRGRMGMSYQDQHCLTENGRISGAGVAVMGQQNHCRFLTRRNHFYASFGGIWRPGHSSAMPANMTRKHGRSLD